MGVAIMRTTIVIALALVCAATALHSEVSVQEDVVPEDSLVQFVDEDWEATKSEHMEMRKTTSDKNCRKLADDTEQDVKDAVAAQQKVLDGMDKGQKCPSKGQAQVTATKTSLDNAKADKVAKDKAYNKARDATINFGNFKYSSLTEGQCAVFFQSQVWINAKAKVTSAKTAADKAAGAVNQADADHKKAIADAKAAVNKCQCDVKALHRKTVNDMNASVKAQNDKTWKKAADVRCILDGTPQTKCKVTATPVVVATTLTAATQAASCSGVYPGELIVFNYLRSVTSPKPGEVIRSNLGKNKAGWNADSISKGEIKKAGAGMSFKWCGAYNQVACQGWIMMGLTRKSDAKQSTSYNTGDFFFYIAANNLYVYENGGNKAGIGAYSKNDVFGVRVNAQNKVEYTVNGNVKYTSTQTPVYPLVVDSSFHTDGKAYDIKWTHG